MTCNCLHVPGCSDVDRKKNSSMRTELVRLRAVTPGRPLTILLFHGLESGPERDVGAIRRRGCREGGGGARVTRCLHRLPDLALQF